jgi:hypothetical protein
MTRIVRVVMLMLVAVCGAGCQSNVGVGDGPTFSENDTFLLEVTSFARHRYSYYERYQTPKDFHVCLTKSGSCIFRKEYDVVGWDISWQIQWISPTDVVIKVFDFGAEIDHRSAKDSEAVRRPIGEISLHIDSDTGKVTERASHISAAAAG